MWNMGTSPRSGAHDSQVAVLRLSLLDQWEIAGKASVSGTMLRNNFE